MKCPDCGSQIPDEAKFCERCGRAIESAAVTSEPVLTPRESGSKLHGKYEIVSLVQQLRDENRYRAKVVSTEQPEQWVVIREREYRKSPPSDEIQSATNAAGMQSEDPAGPRAKTQDLKRPRGAQPVEPSGPENGDSSEEALPEPEDASPAQSAENLEAKDRESTADDKPDSPSGADLSEDDSAEGDDEQRAAPSSASDAELKSSDSVSAADETGLQSGSQTGGAAAGSTATADEKAILLPPEAAIADDLGELFGRLRALSLSLNHPAFYRAIDGFSEDGRVYLVYPEIDFTPLAALPGGLKLPEAMVLNVAIQLCQALEHLHQRGLRLNDLCPDSVGLSKDDRVILSGLDYVSNDNELQADPILNDGYTAPEIYRGKGVDKRADIFSLGALMYTLLTGERLAAESWIEEAVPVRFYPPHVVSPALERIVRKALAFQPKERYPDARALKNALVEVYSKFRIRAAGYTDVGMVRELNEDSFLTLDYQRESLIEPDGFFLGVVSDGMGGAEAGEVASAIAVATVRDYFENEISSRRVDNLPEVGAAALEAAHRKILEYQESHPEARGMGATGVLVVIKPPEAALAWVGDSRGYLFDGSRLKQLTKDHSLVQRLVDIGQITPEQARHHEHKNVITRSLGAGRRPVAGAEAVPVRMRRGDRVLLCSDGLVAHVDDRAIEEILRRQPDPSAAARELVVAANAGGGTDNTTVIIAVAE